MKDTAETRKPPEGNGTASTTGKTDDAILHHEGPEASSPNPALTPSGLVRESVLEVAARVVALQSLGFRVKARRRRKP